MGWPASTCFNLHQPASASGQGDAEPLSFVHPVQWLWILDGTLVIHCLFPHKYVGGTNKRNKRNATKRNLTCQTIGVSSCFIPGEVHTGFAWTWRRFILMSCDKLETRNISSYPSVSRSKCNCRHFSGIECKVSTIYEWGISKALSNCMCLNLFCWMFAHHPQEPTMSNILCHISMICLVPVEICHGTLKGCILEKKIDTAMLGVHVQCGEVSPRIIHSLAVIIVGTPISLSKELPFYNQRSMVNVIFHLDRKGDYYFNNILMMVFLAAWQQRPEEQGLNVQVGCEQRRKYIHIIDYPYSHANPHRFIWYVHW